jgi:selenocysteine-specific elongation factor
LSAPLACARGDRFVLREIATERIVGGGLILELQESGAKLPRAQAREWMPPLRDAIETEDSGALTELLLRRAGARGVSAALLRMELRLLNIEPLLRSLSKTGAVWRSGKDENSLLLHAEVASEVGATALSKLAEFHKAEPLAPAMSRETLRAALPSDLALAAFEALLAQMMGQGKIALEPAGARLATHRVTLKEDEARLKERIENLAYQAAFQPLGISELISASAQKAEESELARKLTYAMLRDGALVRVEDFALSGRRVKEGAELAFAGTRHADGQRSARTPELHAQVDCATAGALRSYGPDQTFRRCPCVAIEFSIYRIGTGFAILRKRPTK